MLKISKFHMLRISTLHSLMISITYTLSQVGTQMYTRKNASKKLHNLWT